MAGHPECSEGSLHSFSAKYGDASPAARDQHDVGRLMWFTNLRNTTLMYIAPEGATGQYATARLQSSRILLSITPF
jgi:hypothetical protein